MSGLALLVISIYWQVGEYSFVNLDDDLYVTANPRVLSGLTSAGVSWAFTTFHASNWHPLTWLSHMADVSLFGPSAGWHHRMNVFYHLAGAELLFLVLWRMTGGFWQSAFVAALFAVHPLHAESVAWVSERKNLLSTIFWILTMGAYLRYVRKPGVGRYLPVVVLFLAGLLCKPMLVTLPFALLLLDWWPLCRATHAGSPDGSSGRSFASALPRLIGEKVPLLGLSIASSVVTVMAQARSATVMDLRTLPMSARLSEAIVSCAAYLKATFWPSSLAVLYPHPASIQAQIPAWKIAGALLIICMVTAASLWQRRRHPYVLVGWLWFLGTLVPVLGLVQVGAAAMADRYMYVPSIGLFIVIAWGASSLLSGWRFRQPAAGVSAGALLAALSVCAWNQAAYWRDSITMWSRSVAVTDRNWVAFSGLGEAYLGRGQTEYAIACFRNSLGIMPENAIAWNNLGIALARSGQPLQAMESYRFAVQIRPDYVRGWNNLGNLSAALGNHVQALEAFRNSVAIEPNQASTWYNLGIAYERLGQRSEFSEVYRRLHAIDPEKADALALSAGRGSGFH